jgi:hypothetical protein
VGVAYTDGIIVIFMEDCAFSVTNLSKALSDISNSVEPIFGNNSYRCSDISFMEFFNNVLKAPNCLSVMNNPVLSPYAVLIENEYECLIDPQLFPCEYVLYFDSGLFSYE